jgi:hypothetical protein
MLPFVAIDYMRRHQSLLVLMAEQAQCVGFTVDQCLVPSIQVWEEPGASRKDRVGPKHQRLRAFSLTLHPEKTRLIEFGRFAAKNRELRGLGKPETFKFLAWFRIRRFWVAHARGNRRPTRAGFQLEGFLRRRASPDQAW